MASGAAAVVSTEVACRGAVDEGAGGGSGSRLWLILAGALAVGVVLLAVPWLHADPPRGLTWSNSPYSDEGLYNNPARNFVLFHRFATNEYDLSLTDPSYAAVGTALFAITSPDITATRGLSIACIAGAVLVLVLGLRRPLGCSAAALIATFMASTQLLLLYARIGVIEPFVMFWLTCGFVIMTRVRGPRAWVGGGAAGVCLALALSAKLSAVVAVPAVVGVPALMAVARRDRARLVAALSAVGVLVGIAAAWYLVVLLPNWHRFQTAFSTLNGLNGRPNSISGLLAMVERYVRTGSDHAVGWTLPVTVAAMVGGVVVAISWRRVAPPLREAALAGLVWSAGWLVVASSPYAPNRYVLVIVPGLAILAGVGIAALIEVLTRPLTGVGRGLAARPALVSATLTAAGALVVGLPGVVGYVGLQRPVSGTRALERDQAAISSVLPRDAVVYGVYAPLMLFPSRARTVVPWEHPPVNVIDPVRRFGVTHVLVEEGWRRSPATVSLMAHGAVGWPLTARDVLVRVRWGPHLLTLYRLTPIPTAKG